MCDGHGHALDDQAARRALAPSRRGFLGGLAALGVGTLVGGRTAAAAPRTLTGRAPLLVATHVHASYSEHGASWDQQYARAVEAGVQVVFQTDHDHQALAVGNMPHLRGTWLRSTAGPVRQSLGTLDRAGRLRVLAEAATASGAATTMTIADQSAWASLRTGIAGVGLGLVLGPQRMDPGTRLDLTVTLSLHPACGGRPAGTYRLVYRYGPGLAPSAELTDGGLTGVLSAPLPPPGTRVDLVPERDAAATWPDLLSIDNGLQLLAVSARSPGPGAVADMTLTAEITYGQHDPASVTATLGAIRDWCAAKYPSVTGYLSQEISTPWNDVPHVNPLGVPLALDPKTGITRATWADHYAPAIAAALQAGGAVTWNHVFGPGAVGALTPTQQAALLQSTFAARWADRFLGATCLEVYTSRGGMPMQRHLDLSDALSRGGRAMTLIGAHDDHLGATPWAKLGNGWVTGVHAPSVAEADLTAALNAGRAFAAHLRWPGAHLDTLVDAVPMGAMSLSTATSRRVTVDVANLPVGAQVQVVVGPVDLAGTADPGTTVAGTVAASALGPTRTGTVDVVVDTPTTGAFVRAQVVTSTGQVVGVGQPTWLLAAPPPDGIPAARAY